MPFDYTTDDLAAIAAYPFPPRDGWKYDHEGLSHWVHDVLMVSRASDRFSAELDTGDRVINNARFVALATSALLTTVTAEQQLAERLGTEVSAAMSAQNGSRVVEFVEGLLESPPVVVLIPLPPGIIVVFPVPVPEPVPPDWGANDVLAGPDLVALGVRFRAAADAVAPGDLQKELLTASERLIDVGHSRLSLSRAAR